MGDALMRTSAPGGVKSRARIEDLTFPLMEGRKRAQGLCTATGTAEE
jgi:hypothetical protein